MFSSTNWSSHSLIFPCMFEPLENSWFVFQRVWFSNHKDQNFLLLYFIFIIQNSHVIHSLQMLRIIAGATISNTFARTPQPTVNQRKVSKGCAHGSHLA